MFSMMDFLTPATGLLALCISLSCIYIGYEALQEKSRRTSWDASIPTVGVPPKGPLRWLRATIRSVTNTMKNASEGYESFCKKQGLPFILPSIGSGPMLVLPASQLNVLNKPENELGAFSAQMETLQPRFMIGGNPEVYQNPVQFTAVRKHMNKNLGIFAAPSAHEVESAFQDVWGVDSREWRTLNVWETCTKILSRVTLRLFVGLPLCRDETLLEMSSKYATVVFGGAALINMLPSWLRPLLAPPLVLVGRRYRNACEKVLVPFVEKRLELWDGGNGQDVPVSRLGPKPAHHIC